MTASAHKDYLPAFSHDHLLPLYDPLVRLIGADRAREPLLAQAGLRAGALVLDVGCGTGSFAMLLKRRVPGAEVHGVDPDPKALARARAKAARAALAIRFEQGFGGALPYASHSFDRVFSSYVLHHLPADEKVRTLAEVRRVLRPGASLHLLDFAGPDVTPRNFLERRLHGGRLLRDNRAADVLRLMQSAGFADARCTARAALRIGQVAYYAGVAG